MPSQIERIMALEVRQEAQEKQNREALAAVVVQVNGVHQEVKAFESVLTGINDSLVILVDDKKRREVIEVQRNSGPWGKFRDKLIEALATLVVAGIISGIWLGIVAYVKAHP